MLVVCQCCSLQCGWVPVVGGRVLVGEKGWGDEWESRIAAAGMVELTKACMLENIINTAIVNSFLSNT